MRLLILATLLAHSWYPQFCCNGKDCHPVPCSELTFHDDHIWWHGKSIPLHVGEHESGLILPSLDDQCHFCEGNIVGFCAFLPRATS